MLVSNKILLSDFVQKHAKAAKPLNNWMKKVTEATWQSHNDLKKDFPTADYVKNGRYVFNKNVFSGYEERISGIAPEDVADFIRKSLAGGCVEVFSEIPLKDCE